MFRILELVFAILVISATLATCAPTLSMSMPNGVRRAASVLASKSTFPMVQAPDHWISPCSGQTDRRPRSRIASQEFEAIPGHFLSAAPVLCNQKFAVLLRVGP